MTKQQEAAMRQALEALEFIPQSGSMLGTQAEAKRLQAIAALKNVETEQHLSKSCQCGKQTMAWCMANTCTKANITALRQALEQQPAAQWVGLTDEEVHLLWMDGEANINWEHFNVVAYEVEAKLKEKNT